MEALIVAFKVMAPIFILMSVGFGARKFGILNDSIIRPINNLLFRVFLPAMLFISIYHMNMAELFNFKLIAFITIVTLTVFFIAFFLVPYFEKKLQRTGVIIQAMVRGNVVYFGFPIVALLVGEKYLGLAALVIAIVAPLYNIISVVSLETFREGKLEMRNVFIGILKNPMIISVAVALVFLIFHIPINQVIMIPLQDMAKVASPLALILLGGSFSFALAKGYEKEIFATVLVKLFVVPAVALPIAILLGFNQGELGTILATIGAPTAVASFAMAQQMEGDDLLAGQIVVYTSAFAVVSIFIWIVIFKNFGLL
jgi:predicted permease